MAQREILDAEYLGAPELDGDLPGVEGVDLDWDSGAVFCRIANSHPAGMEHEQRSDWDDADALELLYVADPCRDADEMPIAPPSYWHPRWDDDAYGFVLITLSCALSRFAVTVARRVSSGSSRRPCIGHRGRA